MKIVSKTSIRQNLKSLDVLYRKAKTSKKSLFYSKLAILELCGWVEETMDSIVRSCARRALSEPSNREIVEEIILKTHGFDYKSHFRKMLIQVIGLLGVERIERKVDSRKIQVLKSTLGNLRTMRDQEAHTYIMRTTASIDAPSVTISNFERVYEGLYEISVTIKAKGR